jgi:uncharacterized membrane protein YidH (DUF202 family)
MPFFAIDASKRRRPLHNINHAANELTFLAWIGTGITIMALGFVIERLDLLLVSIGLAAWGNDVPVAGQAEIHGLSVTLVSRF